MATILEDKDRKVIPRWRDFHTTAIIGELNSFGPQAITLRVPEGDFLAPKLYGWETYRTIGYASDLVSSAFLLGRGKEAIEAAKFILAHEDGASETARSIANLIIHPPSERDRLAAAEELCVPERKQIQKRIHTLRNRLRDEPRNSVAYVDLARAYTLLDLNKKAISAMEMALKLNPENRFILRSASRLFIHAEANDRAHQLLSRAESTRYDPWLISAEIAVASATSNSPRFAKVGQRLLSDKSNAPSELSELASALATLEMDNGLARNARKIFRQALIAPTENSIAQVEWASRKISGLDFVEAADFDVPRNYEARAWEFFTETNWSDSVKESVKWLYDQPFSTTPAHFGSFLASSVLADYDFTISICDKGLIANPDDPTLLNNKAFALASKGRFRSANKVLGLINEIELAREEEIVVTATKGLIAFRSGNVAKGRADYLKAMELAGNDLKKLRATACIYLAREEYLAQTVEAPKALERALEESKYIRDKDFQAILTREVKERMKD